MRFRCKARYSHWWMNHIIPVSLIDRMHKFANELNSYMLTDQELVTLCALQLINPGELVDFFRSNGLIAMMHDDCQHL